ncbi:MAG: Unknown protein [uncultured Campylobacterales bacterium]|uniref:Uncharacterized protein n=1 Tax=uncultured Campylobacterales bacterium TaxID=352960 RepID=A0A6S6SPR9_9BACT|nr:MAG: Unknown protein [uncultured Campylobacterales bacterium]
MNKNITLALVFGGIFLVSLLFLLILITKLQIQSQVKVNYEFEKRMFYISSLRQKHTTGHKKALESIMKENSLIEKVLGKKVSFKAYNIRFKEFDRISNKVLNSNLIIQNLLFVRKSKEKVDFTLIGQK